MKIQNKMQLFLRDYIALCLQIHLIQMELLYKNVKVKLNTVLTFFLKSLSFNISRHT